MLRCKAILGCKSGPDINGGAKRAKQCRRQGYIHLMVQKRLGLLVLIFSVKVMTFSGREGGVVILFATNLRLLRVAHYISPFC